MRTRTLVLGTCLAVTAALTATACGSGGTKGTSATGPVTVTLMTWESAGTNAAIDKALADFHAPGITVKRLDTPSGNYADKLAALTQAHQLPDLFWCGNDTEQQYASQGLLTDWSSRLAADTQLAGGFAPNVLANWKSPKGKLGGLPSLLNTYGVWYNADAFTAAGLPLPKAGWTWDEMYRDAAALAHKDGASYGLIADNMTSTDGPFTLSTYALSQGQDGFTDNANNPTRATISPSFTEGVTKLAAAIKAGDVAPPGYDAANAQSLLAAGKLPMLFSGQWLAAGFIANKPSVNVGFAPMPQNGTPATLYDAVGVCTPSATTHPDATFQVLKYLDTTVWSKVLPSSPVAPPAFTGAQSAYFEALAAADMPTVATAVKAGLDTTATSGVRFTTNWAAQYNDLVKAYWQPVLAGGRPVSDLYTMATKIKGLIQSGGNG
ncbi:extracellular solute-binding protein [Kitasatospora sp. NPDC001603]|uniref:ABC transporter substrate-binding protein n=1 Tax=Kitasatospora sp. NPDC001603 TaxID=3154388 RepID=UPI003320A21A